MSSSLGFGCHGNNALRPLRRRLSRYCIAKVEQSDVNLFAENATRERLHTEFQTDPPHNLVFAMSHGSPNALWDSNEEEALAADDAANLQGYKIFCDRVHGSGVTDG
ncbi:hypothetical protein HFO04_32850 [Rhizobium laguerreae]|uniref:hypothetical protein n=1 Tax=Rhizobium laguerreae TaxID=1076926 RepID=UPI001C90A03F|nr:hypothetical protein [Rhizobium laguerreae]MBY3307522.1 hypothetical protein [Rhizobium laguerreae]